MANVTKSAGGMFGRNIIGRATYVEATEVPKKDGTGVRTIPAHMAVIAQLDTRDNRVKAAQDGNVYLTNKPYVMSADEIAQRQADGKQLPRPTEDGKFVSTKHVASYSLQDWMAIQQAGTVVPDPSDESGRRFLFTVKGDLSVSKPPKGKEMVGGRKTEVVKLDMNKVGALKQSDFAKEPLTPDTLKEQATTAQGWRTAAIQRAEAAKSFQAQMGGTAPKAPEAPEATADAEFDEV